MHFDQDITGVIKHERLASLELEPALIVNFAALHYMEVMVWAVII